MVPHTDEASKPITENRNWERRILELEKHQIWSTASINRLQSDYESEKETHARVNAGQDADIRKVASDLNDFKYVVYERIDNKITSALTEIRNSFTAIAAKSQAIEDKHALTAKEFDKKVGDLANKLIWATGFLAGLQFFLQVVLPWVVQKGQ